MQNFCCSCTFQSHVPRTYGNFPTALNLLLVKKINKIITLLGCLRVPDHLQTELLPRIFQIPERDKGEGEKNALNTYEYALHED